MKRILSLLSLISALCFASPGGLDKYGGHVDKAQRGYHFHKGPLAGQSFKSREAAYAALAVDPKHKTPQQPKVPVLHNPSSEQGHSETPTPYEEAPAPPAPVIENPAQQTPDASYDQSRRAKEEFNVFSWNMRHLGRKEFSVPKAALVIKDLDMITFQEVNKNKEGSKALDDLVAELKRLNPQENFCWAYSPASEGQNERTAFIWKQSQFVFIDESGEKKEECSFKDNRVHLELGSADRLDREPSIATFEHRFSGKKLQFASVHLVPSGKRPQDEVEPLFSSLQKYNGPMIVAGDFNLAGEHPAFKKYAEPLGFKKTFLGRDKSSLASKKKELAHAYDNFFVRDFYIENPQVINLYKAIPDLPPLQMYEQISDHCPIRVTAKFK